MKHAPLSPWERGRGCGVVFGDVYLFFCLFFSWILVSSCVVACFFVDFGEFWCGVWRGFGDVYLFFLPGFSWIVVSSCVVV